MVRRKDSMSFAEFVRGKYDPSKLDYVRTLLSNMTREEIAALREVTASQGIMLESTSERLCEKGGVHFGSPDKHPAVRLETIRLAGELKVPFTTGILIGIGETREERLDALRAIADLHRQYGHIQEVIIQNVRAKSDTKLADADEPDLDELCWWWS